MLQEATWTFLVQYMATKEDKQRLNKVFKQIDINHDGLLTLDELQEGINSSFHLILKGYNKVFGLSLEMSEIERIFKSIDTDNSGTIEYSEFVAASIDRKKMLSKKRLERVFQMFDKDGSGMISANELKATFGQN